MDRKILASMLIIAVASMLLGAGTVAYFSDTEKSTDNTFTVSTDCPLLTLSPCGEQPYLPLVGEDIKPGSSGVADFKVTNDGAVAGWLSMKLVNCTNDENGLLDPEVEAGDETPEEGELGKFLYLEIWFDDDNDGEIDGVWTYPGCGAEQPIANGTIENLCEVIIPIDGDITHEMLKPDKTWIIGIKWSLASDVGNIIQSDRLTFDIEFTLSESEP